jgi:hypothetical protein
MTLSLNSSLEAALASSIRPAVYIEMPLNKVGGGSTTFKLAMAAKPLTDSSTKVQNIVAGVTPVSWSVDPYTRKSNIGELSIEVSDSGTGSFVRNMIENYYTKGAKVTAKLGVVDLDVSTYADYWSGVIEDYSQEPGVITFQCIGNSTICKDVEKAGLWTNKHPFELCEEIALFAGVPAALIDTSSFDFDVDTTISHMVVRRRGVSYDGAPVNESRITKFGAVDDAKVKDFKFDSILNNATATQKYYPEISVDNTVAGVTEFRCKIYDNYTGGRVLGLIGDPITILSAATGWWGWKINKKTIPFAGQVNSEQPVFGAVSGTLAMDNNAGTPTWEIALGSGSYLFIDSSFIGDPTNAYEAMQELAFLGNAGIIEREDGTLSLLHFDASASAVDHWTADDISPVIRTDVMHSNMINSVRFKTNHTVPQYKKEGLFGDEKQNTVEKQIHNYRATSQTNHSLDGGTTPRVFEQEIETDWVDGACVLMEEISDSDTSFTIGKSSPTTEAYKYGPFVRNHGMSCTADVSAGPSQGADRNADGAADSRFAYYMFDDGEIIKVSATSISAVGNQLSIYDPDTDGSVNRYNSFQIACSTVNRGHLSTTAAAHYPGDLVYDVTIPVILSELILDRFEAGAPIIQVETGLQKYKYQVGDFITLDETLLVGLGFDGVDNTIKWEIISKDVDLSGTPPRINWTLCRVAPASTTSSTVEVIDKAPIDWADISLGPIHDDIDDGIVFVDAGTQQVDKANFVYDSTNIRVGVGTDTPETLIHAKVGDSGTSPNSGTAIFAETDSTSASVPIMQVTSAGDTAAFQVMADGKAGFGVASPGEKVEIDGIVFTSATRSGLKATGSFANSWARFTSEFQDSAYMATNAYFTGSTWQRDDTGKGSTLVTNGYEALNTWQTYYANSGAGAISLIPTAATDRSGNRVFGQSTLPLAKVHIRESSSGVTPAASTGLFVESSSSSSSVALIHCSSVGANHTLNCYADGKIGMGTNTPGARLHVQASSSGVTPAANTVLFLESSSTSSTVALMHCSGGTVDHAMNLYADGKLGLGTNTPGARLHVKPSSSGATIPANTVLAVESSSTSASVPLAQFSGGSVDNAMNIMADGKVGVGSGSPDVQFHIQASAVTSASANSNTVLMVEKAGSDAWISIHTDTDRSGIIGFGDTSWEGAIVYTHSADQMDFYTTQSVAVRIDSAQRLMIQDSSATPTTVSGFVHIYSKNDSKLYAAFGGSGKADQLIVDGS